MIEKIGENLYKDIVTIQNCDFNKVIFHNERIQELLKTGMLVGEFFVSADKNELMTDMMRYTNVLLDNQAIRVNEILPVKDSDTQIEILFTVIGEKQPHIESLILEKVLKFRLEPRILTFPNAELFRNVEVCRIITFDLIIW